jgi:hypothetical protein
MLIQPREAASKYDQNESALVRLGAQPFAGKNRRTSTKEENHARWEILGDDRYGFSEMPRQNEWSHTLNWLRPGKRYADPSGPRILESTTDHGRKVALAVLERGGGSHSRVI